MSQKRIINCGPPSGNFDVTRKSYVDNQVSRSLRLDGTNKMTSNLDMNNEQIKNLKDATHNQDAITLKQVNDAIATTSTNNNKYTDQKIAESHISTHENRKNVLAYVMDTGEFTADTDIQDVNLIDFNDMPHKTSKKAFSMKIQRTNVGSEYKGRFDFDLFKVIRDDFSDKYTVCVELYFQKDPFYDYESGSTILGYEALNMNIDLGTTIKVNSEYKYPRTILNLSPDSTSKQIQRHLYVNFKSNYDNNSPNLLPVFVLIYGIKDEAKSDLDMTIYDYEKAFEVANNKLQIHVPIYMNSNRISGLLFPQNNTEAVNKSYLFDRSLSVALWGETTRAIASTECNFILIGPLVLGFRDIFIKSMTLVADRRYPLSSNHRLIIESTTTSSYNLNFSSRITNAVNINRFFSNVSKFKITFSGSADRRKFSYIIEHKVFDR